MSYRLACEASDVFAAIASVAGGFSVPPDACASTQERDVPVLHLHGDADSIVPYASALGSLDAYASVSGCDATSSPAVQPASGGDTTCITRDGCEPGVDVTTCKVAGGRHCWFGNATCGTGTPGAEDIVGNNTEDIVASEAIWGFPLALLVPDMRRLKTLSPQGGWTFQGATHCALQLTSAQLPSALARPRA